MFSQQQATAAPPPPSWMLGMKRSSSLPSLALPPSPNKFLLSPFQSSPAHPNSTNMFMPPTISRTNSFSASLLGMSPMLSNLVPSADTNFFGQLPSFPSMLQIPYPSGAAGKIEPLGTGKIELAKNSVMEVSTESVESRKLARALSNLQVGFIPPTESDTPTQTIGLDGKIRSIVNLPWPGSDHLQRPPRDMKRFAKDELYVVCDVLVRNEAPALLLRSLRNPEKDCGLYKPPTNFNTYPFQAGDCVSVREIGYSTSRNKIATDINIRPTPLVATSLEKQQWIPPPALSPISSGGSIGAAAPLEQRNLAELKRKLPKSRRSKSESEVALLQSAQSATSSKRVSFDDRIPEPPPRTSISDSTELGDDVEDKVGAAFSMAWQMPLGKKPPCDMKRLTLNSNYVVCKVTKWGESPALCLRAVEDPENDFGFFKPPAQYNNHPFRVGDCIQVLSIGYSPLRNKIANDIRVIPTAFSVTSADATDLDRDDSLERRLEHVREVNRIRQRVYRAEKRARLVSRSSSPSES